MSSSHRFARTALTSSLVASVVFGLGCGGAPPPPAPAPAASAPVAATPPAAPPVDTSPAAEPDGLVIFARMSKPNEALKVVGGWTQLPMPGADEIGSLVTGETTPTAIDLDQPIDFALTLHGTSPHGAISAAVRSLDDAKAAFSKYKLVPAPNGALRIEGLGKPLEADSDVEPGEARVCELVPAFGPATTRLVCAESDRALRELGPWLARTAPRTTFPADVHVEVRFSPVRPFVAQMRRMLPMFTRSTLGVGKSGLPELEGAFTAAIDDLADFASDAETVSLDAMLGEPQATITLGAQLRSTSSLLGRWIVAHPERAAPPPATFWKVPADADSAYFHRGFDAADFEHPRDYIASILAASLAKDGLGDTDRKAVRDAATHTMDLFAQRSVYAKGIDVDAVTKAVAAAKAADDASRDDAERTAAEKLAGWFLVGFDAPASSVAAVEKEWATTWARPGVTKWVASRPGDSPASTLRMAAVPKGIAGKDAAHLEIVVPRPAAAKDAKKGAKKPPAGKPTIVHVLVVPDGGASWVVFSPDLDLAVAKVKEAVAGSGGVASRPGLAAMKDARMTSGGFISLRTFLEGSVFAPVPSLRRLGGMTALAALPDQGTTPILLQTLSMPGGGASPAGSATSTITIPKAAIESFVRMAMH